MHTIAEIVPLSEENAFRVIKDIAKQLSEMHNEKLVYRNLSPSNILIDDDNKPVLRDISNPTKISQEDGINIELTQVFNTSEKESNYEGYVAPETYCGIICCPATDFFSLGMVLHYLLTAEEMGKIKDYKKKLLYGHLNEYINNNKIGSNILNYY